MSVKHPEKRKKKQMLTKSIWLIVFTVLLLFLATFAISTTVIIRRSLKAYELREADLAVTSMVSGTQANLDMYKEISRLIPLSPRVAEFLEVEHPNWAQKDAALSALKLVPESFENLDSLFLFRKDNQYISSGEEEYELDLAALSKARWLNGIRNGTRTSAVVINGDDAICRKDGTPVITIAVPLKDDETQDYAGMLLVNVSFDIINNIVNDLNDCTVSAVTLDGSIVIGDTELAALIDRVLAGDFNGFLNHRDLWMNEKEYTVVCARVPESPFYLMSATHAGISVVPREIFGMLTLMLLVFLCAMFVTGGMIRQNLALPIRRLITDMEHVSESGWLKRLDEDFPDNEIGMLSDSYNVMIEHLNVLFNQLIENEKTIQRAEMRVLYEQVKPHFLYNSLEAISYMALSQGAEDVYNALETLGNFYRNFLSKGDRMIPLKRELRIIRDYLTLQKLRYGDMFCDEYDIDEATLPFVVPKLLLQPLVENCIYHGIKPKGEDGVISITTRLVGNEMIILVRDNGVGMREEEIRHLLEPEEEGFELEATEKLHGFGLRGSLDRLQHFCGEDDVVTIRSEPGEYTEIEMRIPTKREEDIQDVSSDAH